MSTSHVRAPGPGRRVRPSAALVVVALLVRPSAGVVACAFLLVLLVAAVGPVQAGDPCASRELDLAAQGTLSCSGNSADDTNDYDPGAVAGVISCVEAFGGPIGTPGRDELWTLTLPPATLLEVVVTPTSGWDPAVYASTRSEPDSLETYCVGGRDAGFDGSPEILSGLQNPSATEPLILYLVVDSASSSGTFGSGSYILELRTTALTVGEGNDCASPIAVDLVSASSVTLAVNTCAAEDVFDAGFGCPTVPGSDLPGRDLIFAVTVPDSSTWSATATPGLASWDVALAVFSGACTAPFGVSCLDVADAGREGDPETVGPLVTPVGAGERTYYLVVDSRYAPGALASCGDVEILLTRTDVDEGTSEDCLSPRALTVTSGDVTRFSGITCPFFNNLAAAPDDACADNQLRDALAADDQVFRIEVDPAVSAWSVQLVPEGTFDPALVLARGSCEFSGEACVAAVDVWGPGKPEGIFNIASAGGGTFFLVVDAMAGCGGYELLLRGDPGTPVAPITWTRLKERFHVGEP